MGTGLGSGSGAGPWRGVGHGGAPLLRIELKGEGSGALVSNEAGRRRQPQVGELGLLEREGHGKSGAVVPCSPASSGEVKGIHGRMGLLERWSGGDWLMAEIKERRWQLRSGWVEKDREGSRCGKGLAAAAGRMGQGS